LTYLGSVLIFITPVISLQNIFHELPQFHTKSKQTYKLNRNRSNFYILVGNKSVSDEPIVMAAGINESISKASACAHYQSHLVYLIRLPSDKIFIDLHLFSKY
jgi:hypothetical protein